MNEEATGASKGNWQVLTVYFSHSGNTRACAQQIREMAGGDLFEIVPEQPYPRDYDIVVEQARQELHRLYKPALQAKVERMADYDVVFVGSPNWWNTVAPPVMTFLSEHDLAGKAIMPFITHEGSGLGQSVRDIAGLCPDSTVVEGLAVRGGAVNTAGRQLTEWLRRLGM